jgi:hypothetical protein
MDFFLGFWNLIIGVEQKKKENCAIFEPTEL